MSPGSSASGEELPPGGAVATDHEEAHAGQAGRAHFQQQLRELEANALGGLELIIEQLDRVLEALEHQDVELAQMVIADDDRVDGRYLEVHQGILSLLALQAPVAGDLRLVAALLHLIKHIERMGDQCVNIAKLIPLSGHEPPVRPEVLRALAKMGAFARSEVVQAKAAFAGRDIALAEDLVRQDREINRLNREIFRLAIEIGDDPDTREWAMHMILVARALERIGDNAVDIGEQVAFVVTGLFREFSDSSRAPGTRLDAAPDMGPERL
jgi:phosphate transport system protein